MKFKQNVLFIVVDDLRPALGCYEDGMAYTPNIDRLAERSVIFKNAYAQCIYFNTVAVIVAIIGISSNHSDDQPYSWSEEPYHPPTQQFKNARVCHQPDGSIKQAIVCPVEVELQPGQSLPDLQSLQEAVKFLNTWPSASSKSFFLAVGFHKPHIPLKYPRKYRAHVRPFAMPTVAWNPWTDLREREDIAALNVSFPFGPMPGWSMAEHGEWAKYSNFDIALRVPFILHVPGLTNVGKTYNAAFASTDVLVELVDLLPSLADLAGLSKVPLCPQNSTHILLCTEGTSIAPLLQDMANKMALLLDILCCNSDFFVS
ncbi:Iduronate 2-sulfatase [Blattella germanica]|nr:Iduronate 2-sulfatase [Blattella germanica]